jgi:hypothetical protein
LRIISIPIHALFRNNAAVGCHFDSHSCRYLDLDFDSDFGSDSDFDSDPHPDSDPDSDFDFDKASANPCFSTQLMPRAITCQGGCPAGFSDRGGLKRHLQPRGFMVSQGPRPIMQNP